MAHDFSNNHLIVIPEYSCEIFMCWGQRRLAVALKELLTLWEENHWCLLPEEILFLMNLRLCGSSLASLGPCPELRLWGWHGFHTWTSTGQLRAQQGKQDMTWPPVWEGRQCFSFPASPIRSSILVLLALGETCLDCWALQEGKHANSCSLKIFSYLLLAFAKGLQYFDIFLRV